MPRQRDPFRRGSEIKRQYKIVRKVGCGGFGVVYRARDKRLRRDVAIKALIHHDDDSKKRFVEEAYKLARLNNQYVVSVYNRGKHKDVPFFVMEFVKYTLAALLDCDYNDSWVEPELATKILRQTLEGLAEVHDRGWTHRDIKPGNILLSDDDEVRLADFGLIKDPDASLTEEGAIMGTLEWMAPEQRKGLKVSERTDIYAFGLVAFRTITGEHYSHTDSDLSLFIDKRTARLVSSCLEERPSDRPKDARAVLQEWDEIQGKIQNRRRRPRIRGDALVGNVRSRIEREYGLPEGSVKLIYPGSTRAVRANIKVSRVREKWDT